MFPSVGSCCLSALPPSALGMGGTQGKQMGVKVEEYCVLELTAIHNTSAQIAESPDLCQREGDGGAVSKVCSLPGGINTAPSVT